MAVSLLMFDGLEGSKVKVTKLNGLITLKPFILGTKFVLVTYRKSYVGFQIMLSLLMFDDLEGSKVKVTNRNCLITLKRFILGTKFVLVTYRKSCVGFQMVVSPLMLDDLEMSNSRSQIKITLKL